MKELRVVNADRDALLGDRVALADRWWTRLRGLLGRPPLSSGEGLLIRPSRGVHMYGMKYAIDVALLDREGRICAVYPGLAPRRRTRIHAAARIALELPAGVLAASGSAVGDRVTWGPLEGEARR